MKKLFFKNFSLVIVVLLINLSMFALSPISYTEKEASKINEEIEKKYEELKGSLDRINKEELRNFAIKKYAHKSMHYIHSLYSQEIEEDIKKLKDDMEALLAVCTQLNVTGELKKEIESIKATFNQRLSNLEVTLATHTVTLDDIKTIVSVPSAPPVGY
jgi:type III secretory pathway component EscR